MSSSAPGSPAEQHGKGKVLANVVAIAVVVSVILIFSLPLPGAIGGASATEGGGMRGDAAGGIDTAGGCDAACADDRDASGDADPLPNVNAAAVGTPAPILGSVAWLDALPKAASNRR